jgi:tetratricopeptide (TPR) repeat protein
MEPRPISLSFRRGALRPGTLLLLVAALCGTTRLCGAAADPLDEALRAAREACRRTPGSVAALDRLAALELRSYRTTHAAETLASARQCVDRALVLSPRDFDARRVAAAILLVEHRFDDVDREAALLHAERPSDIDALGLIADARMESGRYPEAVAAIQEMVDRRPGLPAYTRVSYAREVLGDLPGALRAMDDAIAAADPADSEGLAWCLARSGLLCRKAGQPEEAARRFEHAREVFPRSPYAWEGIGWTALSRGDARSAEDAFEKAFEIVPWPQYAVELRETAEARNRPDDVRRWDAVLRAIERIGDQAGLFNRVLALWEADHGDSGRAVSMAAGELASRKDVYGWDAYAWALYRAGRIPEAAEAASRALARGTEDPLLAAHAGLIFAAAGETDASRLLRSARSASSALLPSLAREVAASAVRIDARRSSSAGGANDAIGAGR